MGYLHSLKVIFLLKNAKPAQSHEETLHKPTLRNILPNKWPVAIKKVKTGPLFHIKRLSGLDN